MDTQIYTFRELQDRLTPVFQQYQVKEAVLFGSYAKGTATPKSDVDLLVDSGLKGLKFVGLLETVRSALGYKEVDLFDVKHIDKGSPIDREIAETGVTIYEQ